MSGFIIGAHVVYCQQFSSQPLDEQMSIRETLPPPLARTSTTKPSFRICGWYGEERLSGNVTAWFTTQSVRLFCLRNFFCGLFFALFKGEGSLCSDNVLTHCSSGFFRLTGPDRPINLLMQLQ